MPEPRAIIFDMDGVIVDSEHLWAQAEREVFSSFGVELTDELCQQTQSMTTTEVTQFWYERSPWETPSLEEAEQIVIDRVASLIQEESTPMEGLENCLQLLRSNEYKIGLATNSPARIIPIVLEKFGLTDYFDTTYSAEFEQTGKPDPAIYLSTAQQLDIDPKYCVAIEDTYSGMLAAHRAGMKPIAYTNTPLKPSAKEIVYHHISHFNEFDLSVLG